MNSSISVSILQAVLQELDREAEALNIIRQAVINKTMLREALDRRYCAQKGVKRGRAVSERRVSFTR